MDATDGVADDEVGVGAKSGRRRAKGIEIPMAEGRLRATVTSWRDQWGWISCPDIPDGDVFAHKEDLPPGAIITMGCAT